MKEFVIKFKHWLIKKLGGYTEQHVNNMRFDVHSHTFKPIKLRAEKRVNNYTMTKLIEDKSLFEMEKYDLAYQLAQTMVKQDLVSYGCEIDGNPSTWIIRADLSVIHPYDAAMCKI